MSYASQILQTMKFDREYSASDLASMLHIDIDSVAYCLDQFYKNGLLDITNNHRYKRRRIYKSKQRELEL